MKRVLVIEDNADNRYLIGHMLRMSGFIELEACNGRAGVDKAIQERPDLILMDIQMPDIDGLEATRQIRASVIDDSIPIVALTSYAMAGDRQQALMAGCTGYIEKPIDPEHFLAQIKQFLSQ